ncbi:helix-turn-helix domain-containing protein, partial [Thomasclavelia ramosa]
FILRQLVPPVTIILLSDLMSEIEMINLFLEKNFSRNRINITPLLLNSYNLEYLNAEKNRIIIITRGIEYLLKSYNFFQNNTIVIIDSRTTLYEKEKISNAIANYEEKQFLKICAGTSLTDTEY